MTTSSTLEQILAISSPFDDTFDWELLSCGPTVEPFAVWTSCGKRIDLHARTIGWQTLSLCEVLDDPEARWEGRDDEALA